MSSLTTERLADVKHAIKVLGPVLLRRAEEADDKSLHVTLSASQAYSVLNVFQFVEGLTFAVDGVICVTTQCCEAGHEIKWNEAEERNTILCANCKAEVFERDAYGMTSAEREELAKKLQPIDNPPENGRYKVTRGSVRQVVEVRDGWVEYSIGCGMHSSMPIDGLFEDWEKIQ